MTNEIQEREGEEKTNSRMTKARKSENREEVPKIKKAKAITKTRKNESTKG
jgi:hypothetical protein